MPLRSRLPSALVAALVPLAALAQTPAATIENASGQVLLQVEADGDVGVGTTAPLANLHVLGNSALGKAHLLLLEDDALDPNDFARLRMGQASGTTYWDIAAGGPGNDRLNIFRSGAGDVVSVQSTGRVGIGTTAPQERLEVAGAVRADRLAYRTPRTSYVAIPDAAFRPRQMETGTEYNSGLGFGGAYLIAGGGGAGLTASIQLPHGARMVTFGAVIYDASASIDLECYLLKHLLTTTGTGAYFVEVAVVTGAGSGGYATLTAPAATTGGADVVDNLGAAYLVTCSASDWAAAGADLRVHRAFVEYTLSEAQ